MEINDVIKSNNRMVLEALLQLMDSEQRRSNIFYSSSRITARARSNGNLIEESETLSSAESFVEKGLLSEKIIAAAGDAHIKGFRVNPDKRGEIMGIVTS